MFWELDCHHHTLETRGFNLPKEFESFLGLNNPKAHGHSVPLFQPLKFSTNGFGICYMLNVCV